MIALNKKVYVGANGCHENRNDAARIQEFFIQNGWAVTSDFKKADLILFKACGALQTLNAESSDIINHLQAQKKSSADLIVGGCLSKNNHNLLRKIYRGPTFGPDEFEKLDEIFNQKTKAQDIHANSLLPYTDFYKKYKKISCALRDPGVFITAVKWLTGKHFERLQAAISVVSHPRTFFIKISTGCLCHCSFCSPRLARGTLKSKPVEKIVDEFEKGLRKGYTEFGLIGTDIGSYGRDHDVTLVTLLSELIKSNGDYKIKLRNLNPKFLIEMMPDLRKIFRSGKISYILTGVQSGNNRILKLMNRGYDIEDFKEAILTLNREFPKIQIRTQVIVGFPSETDEEYRDTARLLDELSFDVVDVFMFNPMPNTGAAKLGGQIPRRVIKRRFVKLYLRSMFNGLEKKRRALKELKKNKKNIVRQIKRLGPSE
ncbi:hypothetical protein AC481_00725 [miscellaneous Crenarchaeota group archaeon SMTZ-80]|nr:MAG: hypothetical protein AC481_00725 [miscellaneous Crenarchaeota group archaeon SMTZ-80]